MNSGGSLTKSFWYSLLVGMKMLLNSSNVSFAFQSTSYWLIMSLQATSVACIPRSWRPSFKSRYEIHPTEFLSKTLKATAKLKSSQRQRSILANSNYHSSFMIVSRIDDMNTNCWFDKANLDFGHF